VDKQQNKHCTVVFYCNDSFLLQRKCSNLLSQSTVDREIYIRKNLGGRVKIGRIFGRMKFEGKFVEKRLFTGIIENNEMN
jgi:hypothetical protein